MNSFINKPKNSVGFQFWRLHNYWQKRIIQELSLYEITHTQFVILASIKWFFEQSKEPTQAEISRLTGIEKMTLSKAIAQLDKMSFVTKYKDNNDTRSICVSLTEKAHKIIPKLIKIVENIDEEVFSTTKEADKDLLNNILLELNKKANKLFDDGRGDSPRF